MLLLLILGCNLVFEAGFMAARMHWTAISFFADPEDLTSFTAPTNQIRWNSDDEFWYKGKLYDALSISIVGDTLRCAVYEDSYESTAYAQMSRPESYRFGHPGNPILAHQKTGLQPLTLFLESVIANHSTTHFPTQHNTSSGTIPPSDGFSALVDRPPVA